MAAAWAAACWTSAAAAETPSAPAAGREAAAAAAAATVPAAAAGALGPATSLAAAAGPGEAPGPPDETQRSSWRAAWLHIRDTYGGCSSDSARSGPGWRPAPADCTLRTHSRRARPSRSGGWRVAAGHHRLKHARARRCQCRLRRRTAGCSLPPPATADWPGSDPALSVSGGAEWTRARVSQAGQSGLRSSHRDTGGHTV